MAAELRTGPPELTEFWRAGVNRGSYPGEDASRCVFGPCSSQAVWRFVLGDMSEHVARLNYCERHAILVASTTALECTECRQVMRIEIREKMDR